MMISSIHTPFYPEINGFHLWAVQVMEDIVSMILKLFLDTMAVKVHLKSRMDA